MLNDATQSFIRQHRFDDPQRLALHTKNFENSDIDLTAALTQIAGRQHIRRKLPSWYDCDDLLYPPRLSLEQCSSETTARHKAACVSGTSLVDLTGGFGVDTAFLAPDFFHVVYVEKDPHLAAVAQHNFAVLGLKNITTHCGDCLDFLRTMPSVDCIYMDPARRTAAGKKAFRIEDCEPDILKMSDLLLEKAARVVVKLSPMLDIAAAEKALPKLAEIHIVSVDNECKELLLFLERKAPEKSPFVRCVNYLKNASQPQSFGYYPKDYLAVGQAFAAQPQTYIYEPNSSLMKAACFAPLSLHYALQPLHPDSHLLTSEQLVADFPGRIFRVEAVFSMSKNDLKTHLSDMAQANITTRNFPLSANELQKKLKLKDGGTSYLLATTLSNGKHVLIRAAKV
ncbi:MAG: class I SAM-dependent methyltransferase [Candidatus Symbiothrix sp.]|jgi:protein-L-isoaspartate O-methyltransferase|nr:class I SAM-dependent methyltransferase [Candidatus Symbiothrix sp.]